MRQTTQEKIPELTISPVTPCKSILHMLYCRLVLSDSSEIVRALEKCELKVDVWAERYTFPTSSSIAQTLRDKQALATLHDDQIKRARVVVFSYSDGMAEIYLTASRAYFTRKALEAVIAKCQASVEDTLQESHVFGTGAVAQSMIPNNDIISGHSRVGSVGGTKPWIEGILLLLSYFPEIVSRVAVHTDVCDARSDSIVSTCVPASSNSDIPSLATTDVGMFFSQSAHEDFDHQYRAFGTKPYALSFEIEFRSDQSALINLHFDSARFSRKWSAHILECLVHIADQIISGTRDIGALNWLPDDQLREILSSGCSGSLTSVKRQRIDEAVTAHANNNPGSIALRFGERSVTYAELDQGASVVARNLIARGVDIGDHIGICMDRSPELIVIMLGVLKAGGAYVPVDPCSPKRRVEYIIRDAQIKFLIAEERYAKQYGYEDVIFPEHLKANSIAPTPPDHVLPYACPDSAAYIIYTSGSTGSPKGVVVPHENVLSLAEATIEDFALSGHDVWTFFHSAAFDFSVWEIWGCLLTGAKLVIVPFWVSRAPDEFFQLVKMEHVTVLSQTPSAFYQFMEQALFEADHLDKLRLIVLGGESLDSVALIPWFDRYPEARCRVVNMFGITETTVHVTKKTIVRGDALDRSRSVGQVLHGWHIYIMDEYMRPLPFGALGEIYVGGAGVATQYFNRPNLNSESFLADPYREGRMYRSGDRGSLLDNGDLIYEGRQDEQVKLRGFRIELGEIRQVLLHIDGVRSVAVVLNDKGREHGTSARLDCYLVLDGTTEDEVKEEAAQLLPEYMLPSTYTCVRALPLTTNGKLDIAALPAPSVQAMKVGIAGALSPPQFHGKDHLTIAEQLQSIWSQIFGFKVEPSDNFFDLGGNSLIAVRIVAMARKFNIGSISIREIYMHQSIEKLTPLLESMQCS